MLLYANGFTCATDEDKTEIIIKFLQNSPAVNAGGVIESVNTEVLTEIVVNTKLAVNLIESLSNVLNAPIQNEE